MTPFPRCGKYDAFENAYPFAKQPPKGSESVERRPILCTRCAVQQSTRTHAAEEGGGHGARHWVNWSVRLNDDHHAR